MQEKLEQVRASLEIHTGFCIYETSKPCVERMCRSCWIYSALTGNIDKEAVKCLKV